MPFAGYKDFADCVAKNGGKKDPKAYCATVMKATEERMDPKHVIEILEVNEAEFKKDETTGKMTVDFTLIKAGRAINPRTYRPSALMKAAQEGIYNGTRMYVDHGDKPPLKRSMRDLVGAVESTSWDPTIGDRGGIRGHSEIFDPKFFDFAQAAKKYIGVSANHQIQVQYVAEGQKSIQDVINIPQAYSVDWVVYPSAGGEILSFARESEGEDQVEWSDITLDALKEHAPQLVTQIQSEVKPAKEEVDDDGGPVAMSRDEISALVTKGVQEAVTAMATKDASRQAAQKSTREFVAKSGLPNRVQARIINQFSDVLEYVEGDVQAAITDAKEELKELGVGPTIKGEGPTGGAGGGKPTTVRAREGVEAVFGIKPAASK